LDDAYLEELIAAGLTEVTFDLKAWSEKLHEWYTGYSNKYIKNSVIGKSCVRERKIEVKRSWITVFPDGTLKRRTLNDYREDV
jgi:pyruvate-formate lyase-activating enzyme